MTLRLVGFAALALLSSACTYRTQAQVHQAPVDYSDYAHYGERFGESPSRPANQADTLVAENAEGGFVRDGAPAKPVTGGALGFVDAESAPAGSTVEAEADSTEYQEVEATPGTACYDAALKAGIAKGVCTLIVERKYLLVGEKSPDQSL